MTENTTEAVKERNMRKVRQGLVVSTAQSKTCVVEIKERKKHPVYGKMITTTKKLHVHDEDDSASVGDTVSVMETRPISKLKRWRLMEIVEKAK
jgi:small subunit ribosomal protein S17